MWVWVIIEIDRRGAECGVEPKEVAGVEMCGCVSWREGPVDDGGEVGADEGVHWERGEALGHGEKVGVGDVVVL